MSFRCVLVSALLLLGVSAACAHVYMPAHMPSAQHIAQSNARFVRQQRALHPHLQQQQQDSFLRSDDEGEEDAESLLHASPPTQALDYASWANKKVLFVTAHPDDIEAGAGGLIALLTAQGTQVFYGILTNGDKGCANPICANMTTEEIAVTRAQEALNAAAVLNVPPQNVHLFDYEDSQLTSYEEQDLRQQVIRLIREVQPNILFSWLTYPTYSMTPRDLWLDLGYHPDHMASAKIALDSHMDSLLGLMYPELGPAWTVEEYYMFDFSATMTHYVDIAATIAQKAASYAAHQTQVPSPAVVLPMLEIINGRVANVSGAQPAVTYAEGFLAYF